MAKCYFTYSREDNSKKAETLNLMLTYLKDRIESLSGNTVSVIYDIESFREGEDFLEREKEISCSDGILIFFTPEYKNKIESRKDHGAYREYTFIKERAECGDDSIIPILLSGNVDSAVPEEFKSRIYWDLSRIKDQISQLHGKIAIKEELKKKLDDIAKKAIKEAKATEYCKEFDFSSIEEEYQRLFLDTAAGPLPSECVIRTSAHDRVTDQSIYFIIGRKGSGKTTLLNSLQKDNIHPFLDRYKHLISIDTNTFETDFIYTNLIQQIQKDLPVLGLEKVLDVFWSMVFFLQGILIIGVELENFVIDEKDKRYSTFKQVTKILKTLLGFPQKRGFSENLPKGAICHCAVELLSDHIKHNILNNASSETPLTAAYNSIDAFNILSGVFGKSLLEKYCRCVKQCTKKFFLALDGFDPHSEDFRKTTNLLIETNHEEYEFRKNFEIRLFRELLVTVSKIKNKEISLIEQDYYSSVHFCIIIPQDRFDEIALDDRDVAKRHFCNLCWDAHDLLEMLVKRLEYFYERGKTSYSETLEQHFYRIIKTYMPSIPTEIQIIIDDYPYSMPLFNYLLRLTFWRPRDIIMNFAIIMKLSKEKGYSQEIITNIIKKYLVTGARKIIENEFIAEYKHVYFNLREVLLKFREFDLILDYQFFIQQLSKIEVASASSESLSSTDEKLKLLYKLGVVGLYFKKDQIEKYESGHHISYCFNEGLTPLDVFLSNEERNPQVKIIFNPIFCKYLSLNINTKELICNYSWDYIETNHALKDDIRRF